LNVNQYNTMKYKKFPRLPGQKNKPNSNPIFTPDVSSLALEFTPENYPFVYNRGSGAKLVLDCRSRGPCLTAQKPTIKPLSLRTFRFTSAASKCIIYGNMLSSDPQKLLLLILYFAVCLCTGCAFNPITGQEELMLLPEKQDFEIGRQYAPEIEKELGGKIENEDLQNYIDSVGQKIARISHKPNWEYHYVAVNDKSINASALPGGYIFITKGMLEKLQTEAQLAAILAHETAHVVARDTSNAISNQIGIGLLLAAATSGQSSGAVMTAAELSRRIIGLRYSRQDEREADIAGLDYMVVAGYNPYGIVETMQMLEEQQKERVVEFLSSHPPPENRIAYLTQRIKTKNQNLHGLNIGKEQYCNAVLDRLTTQDYPPPPPTPALNPNF